MANAQELGSRIRSQYGPNRQRGVLRPMDRAQAAATSVGTPLQLNDGAGTPLPPPGITGEDIFESVRGVPGQPTVGGPPNPIPPTAQPGPEQVQPRQVEQDGTLQGYDNAQLLQMMAPALQRAEPGAPPSQDEFDEYLYNFDENPAKSIAHIMQTMATSMHNAIFEEDIPLPGDEIRGRRAEVRAEKRAQTIHELSVRAHQSDHATRIGEITQTMITELTRAPPEEEEAVLQSLMQQYGSLVEGSSYDLETAVRSGVNMKRVNLNELFQAIREIDGTGSVMAQAIYLMQTGNEEGLIGLHTFLIEKGDPVRTQYYVTDSKGNREPRPRALTNEMQEEILAAGGTIEAAGLTPVLEPIGEAAARAEAEEGGKVRARMGDPSIMEEGEIENPFGDLEGTDISRAVGFMSGIFNAANKAKDYFGANLFDPEVAEGREILNVVDAQTKTTLTNAVPGRPNVYLLQLYGEISPAEATGPEQLAIRIDNALNLFRNALSEQRQLIKGELTLTQRGNAVKTINALKSLTIGYEELKKSLDGGLPQGVTVRRIGN